MKSFIKSALTYGVRICRRIRRVRQAHNIRTPNLEAIFTDIYRRNSWADQESVSGRGSTLARTDLIRRTLPTLLESVGAKSLLDAACGDINWMRHVDLRGMVYIGADVVPELIARNRRIHEGKDRSFVVLDITSDEIPKVDVILCRDCFIHLSFKHIHAAITNFKNSNSMFLLATTHATVQENKDTDSGGWRSVNLQLSPFNFPPPVELITDDPELGKYLGMWSLAKL